MLPAERQQKILEDIEREGVRSIGELSGKFAVSAMTIRRDLHLLERERRIRRTHGGAIRLTETLVEPRYVTKQKIHAESKQAIARYAVEQLVQDNDILVLEGGTTVTMMVAHLRSRQNLTVVTNGLYTCGELASLSSQATVICTGGILREVSATFVGPIAERFFQEFHSNRLFLSTTGYSPETGFTDPSMLETQVKKAMIAAADQVIMLMDSTKFHVKSLTTVARPEQLDLLITDAGTDPEMLHDLRERGVDVHVVA
jgi:DeoR/GlpR family transcriptional regulator of sugar metabolism